MSEFFHFDTEEEFIPENQDKVLNLSRNEALFIDDNLSMLIEKDLGDDRLSTLRPLSHTAGLPAPIDLLEKIGVAILYTTDSANYGQEAEVIVSDTDLYMLREIAVSYAKVGDEPVGFQLKRKIYKLLFEQTYHRNEVARNIIAQIDPAPNIVDNE